MYKKEDYMKLIVGGFTIGIMFLIACSYFNGLGIEKGYNYARWKIEKNETLPYKIDTANFADYKFEIRPKYDYDYGYYSGIADKAKKPGRTLRSVSADLYSPRQNNIDKDYLEYLDEQEKEKNDFILEEDEAESDDEDLWR